MLVLSRKKNQRLVIGDNVVVEILSIQGKNVRLGISAPRSVPVHRSEVHDDIEKERNQPLVSVEEIVSELTTLDQSA